MSSKHRLFNLVVIAALILGLAALSLPARVVQATSPNIVISRVIAGDGNTSSV